MVFLGSGNVRLDGGAARKRVPIARHDMAGAWIVRARHILSGHERRITIVTE